jgi:2-oxoglutarate dehydrogenase E2 component (dihydrolipoamide succinyltransferase)
MIVEVPVPSPGESISEVEIANWLKNDGDFVQKDEEICEIDSDKATLTVSAVESGKLTILAQAGETVAVGSVICKIDTSVQGESTTKADAASPAKGEAPKQEKPVETAKAETSKTETYAAGHPSIAAKKLMDENNIPASKVPATGKDGRITKQDVVKLMSSGFTHEVSAQQAAFDGSREVERKKMSSLRKKIAERLVSVKNETAMLTTFNEIDMSNVMEVRKKYKDTFKDKHGVGLGFMSFFTKAVSEALKLYPAVNAMIDSEEIVYHNYTDIGIAVSAPKGLMVPVVRNVETMSLAEIEKGILDLAKKARDGKISVEEMTGGTFTITNGGVFGSLMSTPIINPPQSAILGMHNIVERPIAVNGEVKIRPMMYVALSYDHRIIDGRESVGFLVKVKEMIENPMKLMFGAKDPAEVLLGL